MPYDSATDTALAGQAYQRALNIAAQNRARLNSRFGLNADGSMDNTAAGQLGDVYQTNLQSVEQDHQAEVADRRRGFGLGGLGGKMRAAADRSAQSRQALTLRDATDQLGQNTQESQFAEQDYQNQKGLIGSRSAYDLAQTLAANPVYGAAPAAGVQNPGLGSLPPARAAAQVAALKKNPRAAQTARNSRY